MTEPVGLLVIDKPAGLTSHDVVARVRRLLGTRRVGHAGTLDPMATGVLLLGIGRGTKLLTYLTKADKEYRATVRLGATTITDDAEGEVIQTIGCQSLDSERLESALNDLRGPVMQVPSTVSAIKVDGKRSYRRVRDGEDVVLPARPITIHRLEILGEPRVVGDFTDLDIVVDCSSGTYIRAIARDLGQALGVGGHLTALRRTRIGSWGIDQATELPEHELIDLGSVCRRLFPVAVTIASAAERFRNGQAPAIDEVELPAGVADGSLLTLTTNDGGLVGLARLTGGKLKTEFVGNPA